MNSRIKFCAVACAIGMMFSSISALAQDSQISKSYMTYRQSNADKSYTDEVITVFGHQYASSNNADATVLSELDGKKNILSTGSNGYVEWEFSVQKAGLYNIEISYYPLKGKGNTIERRMYINGEVPYDDLNSITLHRTYTDLYDTFQIDEKGNQLRPVQTEAPRFEKVVLTGSLYNSNELLSVYLKEGTNRIRLEAVREPVAIEYIRFYQKLPVDPYSVVSKAYTADNAKEVVRIEGESASIKSDNTLYASHDRSSMNNSPNDISSIVMNMIGGYNWRMPNQYIEWEVDVPHSGLYKMVVRAKQDYTPGKNSARRLLIDGKVPFAQAETIEFPYAAGFQLVEIGDGDTAYLFELKKGKHTIRLENVIGPIGDVLEQLTELITTMNKLYRRVFMITGAYPDPDRDYNIELSIPEALPTVTELESKLDKLKNEYLQITKTKGSGYATLEKMQIQLQSFIEDIETLPTRLETFRLNISNISDWALSAVEQPLLIDYIELVPPSENVGAGKDAFLSKLWYSVRSFIVSFLMDYDTISEIDSDEIKDSITLWLGTGRDQAQAIKSIVTNDFTPNQEIGVNIRLVDLNVLLPAVAANRGPDIAITLDRSLPMNYAYRGAVTALNDFKDFDEVTKRFPPQMLNEFQHDGKVYALPDKYTFYLMFYRKDILSEFDISVPKTWDDVYTLLPKLQNNYMSIGLPNIDENNIDLFLTLLYQHNSTVYNEQMNRSMLDTETALASFKKFTDFYTKYKVSKKINHLNYFRTGETPIVIMPYTFYANLQAAAPEIKSLWDFSQVPGTVLDDGSVNNTVAGTATGCVIFSNSRKKQAAWEFLKWWTDTDAQVNFGREIESIQGASGRYATSNFEALQMLPWSNNELDVILKQGNLSQSLPEVPGGYMTSRYIISSSMLVINNGLPSRETMMDYNKMINDEIISMRRKFGLS
jgi:ABC-type glycerol-3-phosphate transport system substrate-binding protein